MLKIQTFTEEVVSNESKLSVREEFMLICVESKRIDRKGEKMMKRKILWGSLAVAFSLWFFSFVSEARAELTTYIIHSPTNGIKVLPDDTLSSELISNIITIKATPGEYEPASFVLKSSSAMNGLTLTVSNLTGAGTIPSSSVDLKVIKC